MGMDPFFTSAYKKPGVNHKYDEAFAIFEALPPWEKSEVVRKWYAKIRAKKRLTRKEYTLYVRWSCKKGARKHLRVLARQAFYNRPEFAKYNFSSYDSCGPQTKRPQGYK